MKLTIIHNGEEFSIESKRGKVSNIIQSNLDEDYLKLSFPHTISSAIINLQQGLRKGDKCVIESDNGTFEGEWHCPSSIDGNPVIKLTTKR